jgi:hypothetical protein
VTVNPNTTIPELSIVRLTRKVGNITAGTIGAVVWAYREGIGYEVEVDLGYPDVLTLLPDAIEVAIK